MTAAIQISTAENGGALGEVVTVTEGDRPGIVRVGSMDFYADELRDAYRQVVKVVLARQTVAEAFAAAGVTDPNQAKRLLRERLSEDMLQAYFSAVRVLDGAGELG